MASSRDLHQHDSASLPCSNNCGFFGSPRTNNLCSVCYNQSLPSSHALPSAVPVAPPPRQISLFDQFPPASTLVNLPPSAIQAAPIADTPALPSRRRWVFSVPPEDLVNGQVVFGGGGQSSSPWQFSREPIFFTSSGNGNVLSPSSTDPQIHRSSGSSPHPSSLPVPQPVSSVPVPELSISHRASSLAVPPEDLVNGRVVFGGDDGQSSCPWRFSRDPFYFSFGSGNVLPPSVTDPQVHQSPGSSPHPSFLPIPEPPISATASSVPLPEPSVSHPESSLTLAEPSPAPRASSLAVPHSDAKRSSNRCRSCRKRLCLGLTFKCRCGDVFCSSHRFPDQHGCTVDIKAKEREAIAKENPVIKADKLQGRI